jgi:hypothetical protein
MKDSDDLGCNPTLPYAWGPMVVAPLTQVTWKKRRGPHRVLGILTNYRSVEVHVSPTGRSVRVFVDGRELT